MGTRSLTYVYDSYDNEQGVTINTPIMCMYRQYDGYPSGHGQDLANFLTPITLVNGIGMNDNRKLANGMGCLAAQLVANFKGSAGGFYLQAPVLNTDSGQEYEYHVYNKRVVVYDVYNDDALFDGTWAEFKEFCERGDD